MKLDQNGKIKTVLDRWIQDNGNNKGQPIQCWKFVQEIWVSHVCTLMSMMSENLILRCETDITGLISMYTLQLAGNAPAYFGGLE